MDQRSCRRLFWLTTALCFGALYGAFEAARLGLQRAGGFRDGLAGGSGPLTIALLLVSACMAAAIFRRLGISRDSRDQVVLSGAPAVSPPGMPTAELRMPRAFWVILACVCTGFSVFMLLLLRFVPVVPGTESSGYAVAVVFGIMGAAFWLALLRNWGLLVRADGERICTIDPLHRECVSWTQICSCELVIIRDVCGDLRQMVCIFKDEHGKTLLKLHHIRFLDSSQHIEAFVAYLRARFSDSEALAFPGAVTPD